MELDFTELSVKAATQWFPVGLWVTLGCCLLVCTLGWGLAWWNVRRSIKANDLEVFIAFPITHLFFMPLFVSRDWKAARSSVMVYLMVVLVWWVGGFLTQRHQQTKLDRFVAQMEVRGDSLNHFDGLPLFDESDQQNIWSHPFLLSMVHIDEIGERGNQTRAQPPYRDIPVPVTYRFDSNFRSEVSKEIGNEFLHLMEITAGINDPTGNSWSPSSLPDNWEKMGRSIIGFYKPSEDQFVLLNEALDRPLDIFPVPEQIGIQMRVNHLSYLKQLSRVLYLRTLALIAIGDSQGSFQEMMTGLKLVDSGRCDLAISHLVHNSQSIMILQALRMAQVFQIWSDEQWLEIDEVLEDWDFMTPLLDVARGERHFVHNIIAPLMTQSTTHQLEELFQVGVRFKGFPEWFHHASWPFKLHLPFNLLTSNFSRSLIIIQWQAYLDYLNQMIESGERYLSNPQPVAWSLLEKEWEIPDSMKHGFLTEMWAPRPKIFEKSMIAQSLVQTARIAIKLEWFRNKNGQYPDSVGELLSDHPDLNMTDPLSGVSMLYERIGSDGFLLRMEDSEHAKKLNPNQPFHWRVISEIPSVPTYQQGQSPYKRHVLSKAPQMDVEMMKRYGLMPKDSVESGAETNSEPSNFKLFRNGVYVGGEPQNDSHFLMLQNLGIKTLVSVDGAQPKVELANKYEMNYVHIPIGYDGIESHQLLSIVRVARDMPRPIYVHCHHGKHRGPVAAALICLDDGRMTPNQALMRMARVGVSQNYVGLWDSVREFQAPAEDVELPELVEAATVENLVSTMAKMDRVFERLQNSHKLGWVTPESDPDLAPSQLALLLREWFHELVRNPPEIIDQQMLEYFKSAESIALKLETALGQKDKSAASETLIELKQSCVQCHDMYRNN